MKRVLAIGTVIAAVIAAIAAITAVIRFMKKAKTHEQGGKENV